MNCLKNKKGFSLIEILVAVSIIGIISAIAIPGFQNYRKDAAKVAGDTSIQNIAASYTNCMVLKEFDDCDTLGELGVNCTDCTEDNTTNKLCAAITKSVGGDDFKACFSVDATSTPHKVVRTFGGTLLTGAKICHSRTKAQASDPWGSWNGVSPIKNCTADGDCGTNAALVEYDCKVGTQSGECSSQACG